MEDILFSRRNQLVAYILIIFFAPFIMCRYYLQSLIGEISSLEISLLSIDIKLIPVIAFLFLLFIIFINRKNFNKLRILTCLFILLILYLAQSISDFYMIHSFYDIQNNWHYIAYAGFSYLMYRYLQYRKLEPAKIIKITFIAAALISSSDEFFQLNMTNRVFDIGDIAKDVLGAVLGLIIIFFILENGKIVNNGWKIRQKKLSNYLRNPLSVLFLIFMFAIIFLCISSTLTDQKYILQTLLISIFVFFIFILILQLSRYKICRIILLALIILQLISFGIFYSKNVTFSSSHITIYKGIPIPYFDIMIFENGLFRLVDKKTSFNYVDLKKIYSFTSNILLIGKGETGKGGLGFPKDEKMQFVPNDSKLNVTQVLNLRNNNAIKIFNNLKKQQKKVVFILHHEK